MRAGYRYNMIIYVEITPKEHFLQAMVSDKKALVLFNLQFSFGVIA